MSGPRWDPDGRLWLLDDEPTPRRGRRRSVDVIDRSGTGPGSGGVDLTDDGPGAGAALRPDRGRDRWREPERPTPAPGDGARGPTGGRRRSADPTSTGPAFPAPGPVAGRHGADRPGAGPGDLVGRPPRRHASETSEPDGTAADGHARAGYPGPLGPPVHGQVHRGRHGTGGHAADRDGSDRHAAPGYLPGRHGADEPDVDDEYVLDAGEPTSARDDDTVGYDLSGYGTGRHGSRYRPNGYPRPGSDDRGYLDRGQPGYASDEVDADGYDPDGYAPDEYDPDGYDADGYDHESAPDDERTARLPASGGGTGRRRAPDDADGDAPAAEGPGRKSARRRARNDRSDGRATRRRRWPWVVGGVAAAAAVVPLGLAVLGGPAEQRGSSQAGSVVELAPSSGAGQPGAGQPGAGQSGAAQPAAGAPQPAAAQVTYEVTGTGSASTITFSRGTAVTRLSDTELPWTQASPTAEGPAEYTLTAAGGSGEMSCKISVDGAVVSEEKSDGDLAAVSCSGRR